MNITSIGTSYTPLRSSQSFSKRNEEIVHGKPVLGKFYTQEEITTEMNYWINQIKKLRQEIYDNWYDDENGSHAQVLREAVKTGRMWRRLALKKSSAHSNIQNKEGFFPECLMGFSKLVSFQPNNNH